MWFLCWTDAWTSLHPQAVSQLCLQQAVLHNRGFPVVMNHRAADCELGRFRCERVQLEPKPCHYITQTHIYQQTSTASFNQTLTAASRFRVRCGVLQSVFMSKCRQQFGFGCGSQESRCGAEYDEYALSGIVSGKIHAATAFLQFCGSGHNPRGMGSGSVHSALGFGGLRQVASSVNIVSLFFRSKFGCGTYRF